MPKSSNNTTNEPELCHSLSKISGGGDSREIIAFSDKSVGNVASPLVSNAALMVGVKICLQHKSQ